MVSICIPAFNAEKYLSETLESVRKQRISDWELVVTDDGSNDKTREIVLGFGQTVTQSVRYLRHEVNRGLPASRNTCIRSASSDLVALLDADDLWDTEHLESLIHLSNATNADIVHSGCILFDSATGRKLEVRAPSREHILDTARSLYAHTYIIQPSSAAIRADVFAHIGDFDLQFKISDDMDFWLRAARAGCRFAYSGKETCHYRKHPGALTGRGAATVEEAALVYRKHLDWNAIPVSTRLATTAQTLVYAARMYFESNPQKAAHYFYEAWKLRPMRADFLAYSIFAIGKCAASRRPLGHANEIPG